MTTLSYEKMETRQALQVIATNEKGERFVIGTAKTERGAKIIMAKAAKRVEQANKTK
jgi:hypothetical protein